MVFVNKCLTQLVKRVIASFILIRLHVTQSLNLINIIIEAFLKPFQTNIISHKTTCI